MTAEIGTCGSGLHTLTLRLEPIAGATATLAGSAACIPEPTRGSRRTRLGIRCTFMVRRPQPKSGSSVVQVLVACVFAAGFFSAIPLWALAQQDGWLRVRGGGNPWRCTVTRSRLVATAETTYQPQQIATLEGRVRYKTRSQKAWQLGMKVDGRWEKALGGETTDERLLTLARDLEAARAAGKDIDRELPPDLVFILTLAIAVVFAASGVFIVLRGQ